MFHSSPDHTSPVLRKLYPGELVTPVEEIETPSGAIWIKIQLGAAKYGFVPSRKMIVAGKLPRSRCEEKTIVRDERPMAVGIHGMGETLGGEIVFRYLPFTRIGFSLGVGTVLDEWQMRGTAVSFEIVSLIALSNLSPIISVGFTRLSSHARVSTMTISAFYLSAGLEWMFNWGLFINVGVTYLRSLDLEVVFELEDAQAGNFEYEQHKGFGDLDKTNTFQAINPSFTVGYGF